MVEYALRKVTYELIEVSSKVRLKRELSGENYANIVYCILACSADREVCQAVCVVASRATLLHEVDVSYCLLLLCWCPFVQLNDDVYSGISFSDVFWRFVLQKVGSLGINPEYHSIDFLGRALSLAFIIGDMSPLLHGIFLFRFAHMCRFATSHTERVIPVGE